jgi:hypothetical protein
MTPQTAVARRDAKESQSADPLREEIRAQALAHMVNVVAGARVESRPFWHFIVEGIFPDHLYREMLASLPDPRLYEAFGYEKHATAGASNRGRFVLTNANLDHLLGRQRSLWLGIRDALGCPQFKTAVFERIAPGLAYRFGVSQEAAAAVAGYPLPELFRETAGYEIKPHPDTRRKLVTMQIALPPDDSQRDIGTEFYRRSFSPLAMLRKPRGFEVVKQAPFLPNVAYVFAVINSLRLKSWHGRTMLGGSVGERNTILNIWYADAAKGNQDLVEQYYQAGRL